MLEPCPPAGEGPCALNTLERTRSAAGAPGQLWSAAPPHPVPWRCGQWPAWPSGRTKTRWWTAKRTTLMDGQRHVDTASYPLFADHCPNRLFHPPLQIPALGPRGLCWFPGPSAELGSPEPQRLLDVPPTQSGPWSKHRRPQCGRNLQAGGWGRPCLGAVEGAVRGGRQEEAGSVGREEAE